MKKITAPLLAHLEAEGVTPLSDSVFVNFFLRYCEIKKIREYYLIDKQGSFLCIDDAGLHSFFVVHSDHSLDNWIKNYNAEDELSSDLLSEINLRKKIPFFGMSKEAWNIPISEWKNYFFTPNPLSGRENYFWFNMGEEDFLKKSTHNY